jgi:hypothetical protein
MIALALSDERVRRRWPHVTWHPDTWDRDDLGNWIA